MRVGRPDWGAGSDHRLRTARDHLRDPGRADDEHARPARSCRTSSGCRQPRPRSSSASSHWARRGVRPSRWTEYAERSGPFSALDVLAGSGGWYELREGVSGTCPESAGEAPPGLQGLRALTLSSPADVTSACLEWWGVTLFLDAQDRIRGVAMRLGSP